MDLLALSPLLFFLAIVGGVIAVFVYQWRTTVRRRAELATWALANGLSFAPSDNSLLGLGFHLFTQGEGRGCDNVASGMWRGHEVRVADYWYYTRSGKDRSKSYTRFNVVAMRIDAVVPGTRVTRENPVTWLADRVGFRDITFESEEFNRRFDVHSDDREFAFKLLDARMMEWLLRRDDQHCFELKGSWMLVYCSKLPTTEVPTLLSAAEAFREQVPRLVWADYGRESS